MLQLLVGSPLTSTVHAPQTPTSQPAFAPVSPSSSRSTLSNRRSGATRQVSFPPGHGHPT
jgi:hypothetical protein